MANLKVFKIGDRVNLHDGYYFINMGPGWTNTSLKAAILGSILVPPKATGEFTKMIKYENTRKITISGSVGFNYSIFQASISAGLGREWAQETTLEQRFIYPSNKDLYTYVRFYAIANRYEAMTVKNGKIIDLGVAYMAGGIWGQAIKFHQDSKVKQNLLEDKNDKSFISDNSTQSIKLFKSYLDDLTNFNIDYNNDEYNLEFNVEESSDVIVTMDNNVEGTYIFSFPNHSNTNNTFQQVVVYIEEDDKFLSYVTSIDNLELKYWIILNLEKGKKYYFKFIECSGGKISFNGKKKDKVQDELVDGLIKNSYLDITNKTIFELDFESTYPVLILRGNEFVGKEIFYFVNIPFDDNFETTRHNLEKKLLFKAYNAFYEVKIYRDSDQLITFPLKTQEKSINVLEGEHFIIGVTCKNINGFNNAIDVYLV